MSEYVHQNKAVTSVRLCLFPPHSLFAAPSHPSLGFCRYIYAANNPSESIVAKRRGYGTIVSYNVPPYGRAGLYKELANLRELVRDATGK